MLSDTNRTLDLKGNSGLTYRFSLYTFDSFDDLKDSFRADYPALYLFTRRTLGQGTFNHDLIYIGETGDLSTRFDNHHKEQCIKRNGANCIGIFAASRIEYTRKNQERDLLFNYDFPCNDQNN